MSEATLTRLAPTDNVVRARCDVDAIELRASTGGSAGRTLNGYFAVFNRWTEIDSWYEGRFLERIAPGAFIDTFAARRDQIKVLYDHGRDPQLGNKPLGPITELNEDRTGAYYEVDLIRASYNDEFVIPAVEAGLLGASFRFKVAEHEWVEDPPKSKHNPDRIPERTITRIDPLYEFGPVTFPAYPDGTQAGVRSGTDQFIERLLNDPLVLARFTARVGGNVAEKLIASLTPDGQGDTEGRTAADPHSGKRADGDDPEDPAATVDDQTTAPRTRIAAALARAGRAPIDKEQ